MPPMLGWEERITLHRAEMLGLIERGLRVAQVAEVMQLAPSSVRSQLREVRAVAGCGAITELGRFWRYRRGEWLVYHSRKAGLTATELVEAASKLNAEAPDA